MPRTLRTRTAGPIAALVLGGLILSVAGSAAAQTPQESDSAPAAAQYASGELVIGYEPGTSKAERTAVRSELGATVQSSLGIGGTEVLDLPADAGVEGAVEAAESLPDVLYAEPNYSYEMTASPNDPMFDEMWSLGLTAADGQNSGIGTPRVWNLTTGSSNVTVAVVDTGIDRAHPDLAPNMYTNAAEIAGNGADDDGNGLIDDTRGWDFVSDDNDPNDENGHGTHVAGTIGARGNNAHGVTGVSWDVRLMPLRVLDAAGSGWTSDVASAFAYAGRKGVDVVNASLAGSSASVAVLEAIKASPNTLFVVAAGNSGANVDVAPSYPCSYPLPNVVCVAATDQANRLSSYSNYGVTAVDLAAPGDGILSTWPGGTYMEMTGTSMATPHVAGVAALLQARHPDASAVTLRSALMNGSEGLASLAGRTVTGGRLSAAGAFEKMGDVVPVENRADREISSDEDERKKRCQARRRHQRRGRNRQRRCGGR